MYTLFSVSILLSNKAYTFELEKPPCLLILWPNCRSSGINTLLKVRRSYFLSFFGIFKLLLRDCLRYDCVKFISRWVWFFLSLWLFLGNFFFPGIGQFWKDKFYYYFIFKIYPEDNLRHAICFPSLKDLILIKIYRGKRINVDMAFVDVFVNVHTTCMRNWQLKINS